VITLRENPLSTVGKGRFLTLSFLSHALLFGLLSLQGSLAILEPEGVDLASVSLVELVAPASLAAPAPKSDPTPAITHSNITPKPAASQEIAPQIGRAEGSATQGQLGVQNGAAVSAKERYLYELRARIEQRKTYPPLSKRLGESGVVTLRFSIRRDGALTDLRLQSPSGHDRLNHAALELLHQIARHNPLPPELGEDSLTVDLPIEYVLN
jgi:periplasmic protein TonB